MFYHYFANGSMNLIEPFEDSIEDKLDELDKDVGSIIELVKSPIRTYNQTFPMNIKNVNKVIYDYQTFMQTGQPPPTPIDPNLMPTKNEVNKTDPDLKDNLNETITNKKNSEEKQNSINSTQIKSQLTEQLQVTRKTIKDLEDLKRRLDDVNRKKDKYISKASEFKKDLDRAQKDIEKYKQMIEDQTDQIDEMNIALLDPNEQEDEVSYVALQRNLMAMVSSRYETTAKLNKAISDYSKIYCNGKNIEGYCYVKDRIIKTNESLQNMPANIQTGYDNIKTMINAYNQILDIELYSGK